MTKSLTISIDRQAKKIAIFSGLCGIASQFTPYADETMALASAKTWCEANGDPDPEVVYPRIDSMRVTTTRRRR